MQPIYVARPILVGVADPVRCRTGFEEDIHDLVAVPVLPAEAPAPDREILSSEGRRYVSGDTADMARKRLQPLCQSVERARVGDRHRCLMWAAARAVELDDAIPRAEIAAELMAAARRAGLDDSDADLARQVRNGFKIGIFGAEFGSMTADTRWDFDDEPETEPRSRSNGKANTEPHSLSTIWADEIEIDLSGGGLIDGLLSNTGLTVLYGESGAGKTFVTLNISCYIAAGRPWRGMRSSRARHLRRGRERRGASDPPLGLEAAPRGQAPARAGGEVHRGPAERRHRRARRAGRPGGATSTAGSPGGGRHAGPRP